MIYSMVHCWLGRTMVEINTSKVKDMSVKHGKTRVFSVNGQTLGDAILRAKLGKTYASKTLLSC